MRKHIDFILEETGPKEHKWLDVEVDTWLVREIFRDKLLQIDEYVRNNGMSYKLNFMCFFLFDLM